MEEKGKRERRGKREADEKGGMLTGRVEEEEEKERTGKREGKGGERC